MVEFNLKIQKKRLLGEKKAEGEDRMGSLRENGFEHLKETSK